jgi:hypothetical protein
LVSPEGNVFISFGVNHPYPHLVKAPYNKDYWIKEFDITEPDSYEAYLPAFRDKVEKDMKLLGMNTLGKHCEYPFYDDSFMPYIEQCRFVNNCHYMTIPKENFHNVFSEDFEAHCDQIVNEKILPKKDDPYMLAISFSDCPFFTNLDSAPRINNIYGAARKGNPMWAVVLRNLGEAAAGKQAYTETMKEIYQNDFSEFNKVYKTHFNSFDELLVATDWREAEDNQNQKEVEDNLQFLYKIVDKSYEVQIKSIRKVDTNHMIFGDKLNGNSNTPDEIIKIADKHMDIIY